VTTLRSFDESDIAVIAPLYLDYFNTVEGASWTIDAVKRRLRQLFYREDMLSIILEEMTGVVGFAVGQMTQYDDGMVFELSEIFVARSSQNQGRGSLLLTEIEALAKRQGAFRIQLIAAADRLHHRFYNERHGYTDGTNNVQKTKSLE
jgi:GNAT superfamily N-acetyltransferase